LGGYIDDKSVAQNCFLLLFSLGTVYFGAAYYKTWRFDQAIRPSSCWKDGRQFLAEDHNLQQVESDVKANIKLKDHRFILLSGMGQSVPGLSFEKDLNLILKNGTKQLCVGDFVEDEETATQKGFQAYEYIQEYNTELMHYLN
jgi:hypothetical protein